MLVSLFNTMSPVLVCILIGFGWKRLGFEFNQQFVTAAVMNIGAPCLIISSLNSTRVPLAEFGEVALATALITILCGLLAIPFALKAKGDPLSVIAPVAISNCGNMGLPLSLFAFGKEGLTLAIAFFITSSIFHMTVGLPLFSRSSTGLKGTLANLARQPIAYALVISLTLLIMDLHLPVWIDNTTHLLAGFTIPLMLITLGVSLGSLHNDAWLAGVGYSMLRFGGGLVFSLLVTHLMGITGLAQKVVILLSIMPAAIFNYIFAAHYNRSPEITASIVVTSTLMAFILLPVALSFML